MDKSVRYIFSIINKFHMIDDDLSYKYNHGGGNVVNCSMNMDLKSFLGHNFKGGKSVHFNHLVPQPRPLYA